MRLRARPYQSDAVARVFELFEACVRRVLLVLPTGGGKTVIASLIILAYLAAGKRVLMLAHRRELIKQALCKLVRNGVSPDQIGIIMAGVPWRVVDSIAPPPDTLDDDRLWEVYARRRPQAPVQVGSIDTFRGHVHPPADLVIIDEAHRALSKSYCDVMLLVYPDAQHLGLTATPYRADGRSIREAYDEIVFVCSYMDLVADGFLVEPWSYSVPQDKLGDFRKVRKSGTDYNADALAEIVDKGELVGDIVDHWIRRGNGAPTFAFGVNVAHSQHIAERFNAAGIPAVHVDGNTEKDTRASAIRGLESGAIKVVANCNVFTEGTDVPCVGTIVLARPTLSEALYRQQGGRGSRPYPGKQFIILDHAGCVRQFGRLQDPPATPVDKEPKKSKKTVAVLRTKDCPGCWGAVPSNMRVCPGCGHVFVETEESEGPKEVEGELVLVKEPVAKPPSKAELRKLAHWDSLVRDWEVENERRRDAGEKLHKGGSVLHRWRQETPYTWQPKGRAVPRLTPEQEAYNESFSPSRRRLAHPVAEAMRELAEREPKQLEVWDL